MEPKLLEIEKELNILKQCYPKPPSASDPFSAIREYFMYFQEYNTWNAILFFFLDKIMELSLQPEMKDYAQKAYEKWCEIKRECVITKFFRIKKAKPICKFYSSPLGMLIFELKENQLSLKSMDSKLIIQYEIVIQNDNIVSAKLISLEAGEGSYKEVVKAWASSSLTSLLLCNELDFETERI